MKLRYTALTIIASFFLLQCAPKVSKSVSESLVKENVSKKELAPADWPEVDPQDIWSALESDEQKSLYDDGKGIMGKKCTSCHVMHRPEAFKKEQWFAYLKNEKERAKLTQKEYNTLKVFLFKHAR